MHQFPRQSPRTTSPANSPRTNPHMANISGRDDRPPSLATQSPGEYMRGLGIDRASGSQSSDGPSQDTLAKLNRMVQNYFTKAALIILHSRAELPPVFSRETNARRINKWFNVEVEETDVLKEDLTMWRTCNFFDDRPPVLIIETFLDASQLTNNQSLVILDDSGKRFDVLDALSTLPSNSHNRDVVLERWRIELGDDISELSPDLNSQLPGIYKRSIVLFRSLWTYAKFLPVWSFMKHRSKTRLNPVLTPRYRIFPESENDLGVADSLRASLYPGDKDPTETYTFGETGSPAGSFSVTVTYRTNCEFRVDDSEALLSSLFMGADDNFFRPSLPSADTTRINDHELGSLPADRRDETHLDYGQAYGSLSSFHGIGPTTGASPISALRAARDRGSRSPNSPQVGQTARVAMLSGEGTQIQRRPSLSRPAFKAPPLSASPSLADQPTVTHTRNLSAPSKPMSEAYRRMPPPPIIPASRRHSQIASENAISSSTSASPKQAHISKYSSSFSHRRGRLSSGVNKLEEDNASSGRVSGSSSAAQPSSGIFAEAGGSGSLHADDDNISNFLKLLDLKRDLLSPESSSAVDANTRRTAAALTRFQKMKDANAIFSDSMSSSMVLHKSSASSSRQLHNIPPMITGTSISTASSPGKAISPHTPHTPAIPSRLSSNSIIDYSQDTGRRRVSRQSHDSPLEETSENERSTGVAILNPGAIDIPTSPQFVPDFRRARSAAQRPNTASEDEMGEFIFGMRSMSLGAEDRDPLSLSALLRQQDQGNDSHPQQDVRQQSAEPESNESNNRGGSIDFRVSSGQPPSVRPVRSHGRGSLGGRPSSRASVSSSLGRGSFLPLYIRDRENGHESGTEARRRGGHRFSFTRNFDEDEPLLFTMSDFTTSRRSLEEARREPTSSGRDAPPNNGHEHTKSAR